MKNNSPWISELRRTRPVATADKIDKCDIAIIGAGISGVFTAYSLLKRTDKKIALIEADLVASGATGHNAGHIVPYLERSLASIASEFNLKMLYQDISGIEMSMQLIEQVIAEHNLPITYSSFTEYAGFSNISKIILELEDQQIREKSGLRVHPVYIAKEIVKEKDIPKQFLKYVKFIDHQDILKLLETKDSKYVALVEYPAATANSALLVESIIEYLLANYKQRFVLSENTPVSELILEKDQATLKIPQGLVTVSNVILCTNGFEHITITNQSGPDIDVKFHHMVEGYVGYMAAYTEPLNKKPTAVTFYNTKSTNPDDPYFYVTRRPYDLKFNQDDPKNLVAVGGPGIWLDDSKHYIKSKHIYPETIEKEIKNFMNETYGLKKDFDFMWHGLMGFTKNYLRLVGPEPVNPVLWYNLGCNGVGLLTSIYGADRISRIFAGEKLPPSIFDPKNQAF